MAFLLSSLLSKYALTVQILSKGIIRSFISPLLLSTLSQICLFTFSIYYVAFNLLCGVWFIIHTTSRLQLTTIIVLRGEFSIQEFSFPKQRSYLLLWKANIHTILFHMYHYDHVRIKLLAINLYIYSK